MTHVPVLVELAAAPPKATLSPATAESYSMTPELPEKTPSLPCQIDESFGTVPLGGEPVGVSPEMFAARGPRRKARAKRTTSVVRAEVRLEDLGALEESEGVVAVWSDPEIVGFQGGCGPVDCDSGTPKGDGPAVADKLGVQRAWSHGYHGQGVVIGIVDGGVDGNRYPVVGGWSPLQSSPPGVASHWSGHGNMCAFDSLIAAPQAKIYDLGIGKTPGNMMAFLSSGLQSFQWSLNRYRLDGTPQVMSNSWGLFQDSWDPFPAGDPRNYTHNSNHPLNRKVIEAIDEGILVAFAAGNCGDPCPDGRCGSDHGPGKSIRGANGLERVISVGGVNIHRQRIGYSSQGPATLDAMKPDLCGYSHFTGHFNPDSGTSAACPVVAGVLGLLRSRFNDLEQDDARALLNGTAINICAPGFDHDSGHGVVNAGAAYDQLLSSGKAIPSWMVCILSDMKVWDEFLKRAREAGHV